MDTNSDTQIHRAVATIEPGGSGAGLAARPMYLIVVGGGIPGAMIRLPAEGAQLGRSGENSIRVPDLSVSRRHASLTVDDRGSVWLNDLGSTNGTFLNNRRLAPHAPARLTDGDRIQLGSTYMVKFVGLDPCDERFQRELFERTVRDGLTGLYNRLYFLDQIGPTAENGAARGLGLAVLMVDIDHFKSINDTYGHDVGDAALREVAQVLRECTRSDDLVSRYGGEEFILALPVAAPDQATGRAERIRAAIAARRIRLAGSASPLRITASVGLAFAHPGRARHPEAMITVADQGLYQAKRTGRNRVVFRSGSPSVAEDFSEVPTPPSSDL